MLAQHAAESMQELKKMVWLGRMRGVYERREKSGYDEPVNAAGRGIGQVIVQILEDAEERGSVGALCS